MTMIETVPTSTLSPADPNMSASMAADPAVTDLRRALFEKSFSYRYSYQFSWLGRPIIQYPEDLMAMQELIWTVRPEVIVETGIAHGGSLIFYASMLELLGGAGTVIGVDVDIREHNRSAIESHPMAKRISMIQGSSVADDIVARVWERLEGRGPVMVVLDSNHTHDHVLDELHRYAPMVTKDSYAVVFDTVVEDLAQGTFPNRPWDQGNNPLTAVQAFLNENDDFRDAREVSDKLLLTVARGGYLQRAG